MPLERPAKRLVAPVVDRERLATGRVVLAIVDLVAIHPNPLHLVDDLASGADRLGFQTIREIGTVDAAGTASRRDCREGHSCCTAFRIGQLGEFFSCLGTFAFCIRTYGAPACSDIGGGVGSAGESPFLADEEFTQVGREHLAACLEQDLLAVACGLVAGERYRVEVAADKFLGEEQGGEEEHREHQPVLHEHVVGRREPLRRHQARCEESGDHQLEEGDCPPLE